MWVRSLIAIFLYFQTKNVYEVTKFCKCFACCRSIRVQIRVDTILVRDVPEGQQKIPGYFATPIYDVDDTQHIDLQQVAANLSQQLEEFNRHGSGFVFDQHHKIYNLYCTVQAPTRPQLHCHAPCCYKCQEHL